MLKIFRSVGVSVRVSVGVSGGVSANETTLAPLGGGWSPLLEGALPHGEGGSRGE